MRAHRAVREVARVALDDGLCARLLRGFGKLLGIGFSNAHFLLHGTPNTAEQGRHTAPSSACSPLDSSARNAVSDKAVILRIFSRVIEQCLLRQCPGVAKLDKASVHIGAVAFIHRFGSSLNTHVHFHICAIDGVFESLGGDASADCASPPGVVFHPASGIDEAAVAQVQAQVRTRILRAFAAPAA